MTSTYDIIADNFLNNLNAGKLYQAFLHSPFSAIVNGVQLFYTLMFIGITASVYVKTKNTGTTLIIALLTASVMLGKNYFYPPFLKALYLLMLITLAGLLFKIFREKHTF